MHDPGEDVAVLAEKYGGLYLDEDEVFRLRELLGKAKLAFPFGARPFVCPHCGQVVKSASEDVWAEIERMVG